jgi:hypothetical protein
MRFGSKSSFRTGLGANSCITNLLEGTTERSTLPKTSDAILKRAKNYHSILSNDADNTKLFLSFLSKYVTVKESARSDVARWARPRRRHWRDQVEDEEMKD